jgi:hypothetical protein
MAGPDGRTTAQISALNGVTTRNFGAPWWINSRACPPIISGSSGATAISSIFVMREALTAG